MPKKPVYFKARFLSFVYAFKGLYFLFKTQANAQIHLLASILVVSFGLFFGINYIEWCLVLFAIFFVISLEAVNTALEIIVDWLSPEYHERAGIIKDLAAGAVLLSAFGAFIIGVLIFIPKVYSFLLNLYS